MEEINDTTPFITLDDIKRVFSCENDKAKEIMNNPDLEKFPVGRTWYVSRVKWREFLDNVIKYGLPEPSRGFQFGFSFELPKMEKGKNYQFLKDIGLTDDQIIEGYNNYVNEEEQESGEQDGSEICCRYGQPDTAEADKLRQE